MTSDESEETADTDGEEKELKDLDPNAEEAARKVERQLRRVRLESKQ